MKMWMCGWRGRLLIREGKGNQQTAGEEPSGVEDSPTYLPRPTLPVLVQKALWDTAGPPPRDLPY